MTDKHVHVWEQKKKTITLTNGTAKDTLLQRVCKCGAIETYDLKRRVM